MKAGLTSSSFFGKCVPNEKATQLRSERATVINLKQNYSHERPFVNCKFDIPGNRLYLLDTKGVLIHLNLNDNCFSTLRGQKIQHFTIDGNNSLNILYVTHNSQLFQASFENKKPTKITNLNMNKIRAFERNYLRDMLLALDYKVLFLCDVTKSGPLKIKSLKATHNEVFTNACFASNNRFIILAIKNIEIRIIQIMDLKSVHEIKLPFAIQDLKIEVSYDSKKIAIYGQCNIIFFINILEGQTYSYELIEIPFLKAVLQLRYTCQNDIVFLGNDQVLYAVSSQELDKAIPIFNEQFQIRCMNFDISLDCCKIALVSNRTVMQLKFPQGLRQSIEQRSSFKQMDYRKNGFEGCKSEGQPIIEDSKEHLEDEDPNKIQYEDEDDSEEEQAQHGPELKIDGIRQSKEVPCYREECGSLNSHVGELKGVSSETKVQINSVLNNLLDSHKQMEKSKIEPVVKSLLKLMQDYKLSPQQCYKVLDFVVHGVERESEKLRHYGLILCPEIVAVVERKLGKNFVQFCQDQILALYSNHLRGKEWKQAMNWVLSPGVNEKSENLSIFLLSILEEIWSKIATGHPGQFDLLVDPGEIEVTFAQAYNRVVKVYLDDRYKNLFSKRKIVQMVDEARGNFAVIEKTNDARLEQLIIRQDEIKRALCELKKGRNKK